MTERRKENPRDFERARGRHDSGNDDFLIGQTVGVEETVGRPWRRSAGCRLMPFFFT